MGSTGYSNDDRDQAGTSETAEHLAAVTTADGLRTDGPTIEEWVRRGYPAVGYPPSGYLAVDTVGWQSERDRRLAEVQANLTPGGQAAPVVEPVVDQTIDQLAPTDPPPSVDSGVDLPRGDGNDADLDKV